MPSDTDGQQPQPLAIRMALALLIVVALAGIAMIGDGLYTIVKSELSTIQQSGRPEHRLTLKPFNAKPHAEGTTRT